MRLFVLFFIFLSTLGVAQKQKKNVTKVDSLNYYIEFTFNIYVDGVLKPVLRKEIYFFIDFIHDKNQFFN